MTIKLMRLLLAVVFCTFVNLNEINASASTTPRFISYNSSDLSYLSNGIQFPVPETLEKSIGRSEERLPTMQWLRQLYNHHHWEPQLGKVTNAECKHDMEVYLRALHNESSWAIKMFDASGRYTTNFFYGNDFWLGSNSLCDELANVETNRVIPPFPVHFYAVKIRININEQFTPVTRQIIIGQCLPQKCDSADIKAILVAEQSQADSLLIVDVRPVPGSYRLIDDRKFHIVSGVIITLTIIIAIATTVELYLNHARVHTKVQPDVETPKNNNNHTAHDDSKKKPPHRTLQFKAQQRTSKPLALLLAFSAYSNGKKILSLERVTSDSIRCIHGLRFFSITWIILVHTYLEVFSIADNKTMRTVTERSFAYQTISNATFSVDTFFFISGLLVTMTYFRSDEKSKKKQLETQSTMRVVQDSTGRFLILLFYRFMRLTPAYLFVILVNEVIAKYTQNSSVFSPAMIDHITCDAYWWRNILYINNFFPQHEFCMLWSWYIANDTQFYVLAALLLIIGVRSQRHLKGCVIVMSGFLVTSWITTFIIATKYNYVARVEEPFALFDQLYDKPWLRIGPYLIGMAIGYFVFKRGQRMTIPLWITVPGWICSLLCLSSVVYGVGRQGLIVPTSAFYATFSHTAWGLSIAWIVIACYHGYGGPVDALLSFKGFLPLSRLAYCAYLIHPVIMVFTSLLMDGNIHLFQINVLIIFMGNAVASFMVAYLISLVFEAPVVRLLKIIFSSGDKDD